MITGKGRQKIRPPRRPLIGSGDGEFDAMWAILREALKEIHEKNASKLSFEQLYRASYKIVLKKQGDKLYDKVKEFEEQWFGQEVMTAIGSLITPNLVKITLGVVAGTTANERRLLGEIFLTGLRSSWQDHITVMNMTTDVLMYMDRVYCADNRKASIFTTSMGLFREHILRSTFGKATENSGLTTFDILNSVILDQIGMEREGDVINRNLIRSNIYMLEGLYESDDETENEKLYLTVFEIEFLKASRNFYQKECQTLLRESDASSWLRQTKKRLLEEEDRCQTTISNLTAPKIAKVVEEEMVSSHLTEFLAMEGSGITAMIENDRYEDLTLLYQLISRVDPTKEPLKIALQARVLELGGDINKNISNTDLLTVPAAEEGEAAEGEKSKAPKQTQQGKQTTAAIKWVDEVLQLKDKFDTMWMNCLDEDLILQTALTRSFSDFINLFQRCSEYVSLFIDDNLKRGIKGKTEAEVDVVLDKATTLIRYIQDKDMFERYYKKHLARRLLHGKSESADVEKQMITRMKQEIGNAFTTKLEGMFKDMSMSEELTSGYRSHIRNLGDMDRKVVDLSINVLTTNHWPMESMGGANAREEGGRHNCTWPSEINTLQESFKAFYLKERNGRMLTWLGFLGNADIRCVFPKIPGKEGVLGRERRHEISVPTYGMIILLLFNDLAKGESLSFEEIQERTNIPTQDLSRQLHSLAVHPKCKVLTKDPASKDSPKAGDKFSFNEKFTSKAVKIKAPVISGSINKVEGEEERKDTEERNDEHRGNVIDTVIVRIMKARKELTHQLLFSEVITQLSQRFKPDLGMMKRRTESLIEREYLERVEEASAPTYRYLA
ncbi:Cullin-3-B [Lachnellula hyalina]|uniref:Cullin-3-B n=1 Tax=Lachnellula hyalina TaxID=1316788 RepID=A0A8H8R5A8_9HELO|nr:Cullin-3-B [Lachnellula hyalina]TVY27906.1 Cullin-3-B [Lachnellula hyalina]